jgi:rRNA-processing protein FCF1
VQNSPTAPDETGESPRKGTKMKTDTKDLLYKHFDLFNQVMEASKDSTDFIICSSCHFQLTHKSHTLSVESAINKVIAHMLETH